MTQTNPADQHPRAVAAGIIAKAAVAQHGLRRPLPPHVYTPWSGGLKPAAPQAFDVTAGG